MTVSNTGSPAEYVTAANLTVDSVAVTTGAMLATSRIEGWRVAGSTVTASLELFSCIPVSLSERERERVCL